MAQTNNSKKDGADAPRQNNTIDEDMIMIISLMIALELSRNRTATEIDLIALILDNVANQLATIADLRFLHDKSASEGELFPVFPI